MVSVGIIFLFGILGLVVDVGWGYYRKQVAQAAVDSAVMAAAAAAGSGSITCGSGGVVCNPSGISCSSAAAGSNLLAGCQYAAQNGIAKAHMTIAADLASNTPLTGVTTNYWVKATVSEPMILSFLQVMGFRTATVAASATSGVIGGAGGNGCLYVMDPTAGQALYLNGANLSVTCGVYLNSNNTVNAFQLNSAAATLNTGSASLKMVSGAKIDCSGCGCKSDAYYGTQNPSNTTQCADPSYAAAAADPLASVPPLTPSGTCTATNYSWSNIGSPPPLVPGTYCGGIKITGGNVTFTAGNYILNGGGLEIEGANTTVNGSGVFFFNTASAGNTVGPLLMSGQPSVTLTSQTSGAYEGILYMQDHSVCSNVQNQINGNTNIKFNGSIYLHCTQTGGNYVAQNLLYTGESSTGYYSALVVDTIQINGMSNLVLDPTGGQNTGIGLGGGSKPYLVQ
jgi:hypothetical protein